MKRYAVFTARFALVPMISGPFVVSLTGRESGLEWAHVIAGFAAVYLIIGLLLLSAKYREMRLPAAVALVLALVEAVPGVPRVHAAVSPILFGVLAWATMAMPDEREKARGGSLWIFVLPALVLLPVIYGVGYRHQTSGIAPHIGAAMLAAGPLVIFCAVLNQNHPRDLELRRACNLTIAAVVLQLAFGMTAFMIRLLELEQGLGLAIARTVHITGAAPLLAATTMLAIQYRRIK